MTELFIKTSKLKHGDIYDYTKVNYENNLKEVIIICKTHGEFLQLPKTHKNGNGCKKCGFERTKNAKSSNMYDFIQKAIIIHDNKYDYSKVVYKKAIDKVIIICKTHGEFLQIPNSHLDGTGCNKCGLERTKNAQKKPFEKFINEVNQIHDNKYNYSKVNYINNKTNITIICKTHGEFLQTPSNQLKGKGCKECGK